MAETHTYRFRIGDRAEYSAEIPDGTYSSLEVFLDNQGAVEGSLLLHPVAGAPFRVPVIAGK